MKWLLLFCLLALPVSSYADELEDTLGVDTMHVDWYESPRRVPARMAPGFEDVTQPFRESGELVDWSDEVDIKMDEPRLAWVNITGITSMPTSKTAVRMGWMEVYDADGHYFKKRVILKGQGGYSLKFVKRNFACQFCENDWTETVTPDIRIGGWVKQDAFHFKAFYTDFIRGIGEIGYKLFEKLVADRQPYWMRGGYVVASKRARCFPDGFPCVVYLNGRFYGIYAWQLKKHRKNMNMEKAVAEHVHLDGQLNNSTLFKGRIQWNSFEVRNPKGLYTSSGAEYNGNTPQELIDEQCAAYHQADDSEEVVRAKERTAQVKASVLRLSQYQAELSQLDRSSVDTATFKAEFEKRFDIESLIDYDVFYDFQCNGDGSLKNWQWFTYDGVKWLVAPYDLDQTFGINLYGAIRPAAHQHSVLTEGPFCWIDKYYKAALRSRYRELRRSGVFSTETIVPIIEDWYYRVGEELYAQEKERWPDSPCYGDAICNAGWETYVDWDAYDAMPAYSKTTQYHAGDICKLEGRLWRATESVMGVQPYIRNSNVDSLARLEGWVSDRIAYLDACYGYEENVYDLDGDGQLTIADIVMLINIYLGDVHNRTTYAFSKLSSSVLASFTFR